MCFVGFAIFVARVDWSCGSHYNLGMTLTGHAVAGAMLAAAFPDPALLLVLGVASHYAFDVLPHWDFGTHWREKSRNRLIVESFLDVFIGWGLAYVLYFYVLGGDSFPLLVLGVLAAQLPDWLTAPYHFLNWKFAPFSWAERLADMFHNKLDAPWGVVTQVGALVLMYVVLFEVF